MKRGYLFGLSVLFLAFLLSGCVVRTYPLTRDRIDQDLTEGNRGYLYGRAPVGEEKERKATRTTQVVEIEIDSPIKFEKSPKAKTETVKTRPLTEPQEEYVGNRGYITQSITPEIAKPATTTTASFEKYTVQKNDTLQKISQKLYGTTKKWKAIYEANKDILKGPEKIYVGQVLNIPATSTLEMQKGTGTESLKEPSENLK